MSKLKRILQIDVIEFVTIDKDNLAICHLYTDTRMIRVAMKETDYKSLQDDGFFTRDGKTQDRAGVWNTTAVYEERQQEIPFPSPEELCDMTVL